MSQSSMTDHRIVSREAWLQERKALLAEEKQMTRLRDTLSEKRRALPWVRIEKDYVFDTPDGKKTLSDLFDGRSQLIVKHFMLAPGQKDPCVGCSFEVDHVGGALMHIEHHDVKFVSVARAPLDEIEAVKTRMGWTFDWVSSFGSDFNYDFDVSFTPEQIDNGKACYNYQETAVPLEDLSGFSVFYKNDRRRDLPHLFDLRPRRRRGAGLLHAARSHAEGAQRNRPELQPDRLGASPRPLRQ